MVRNKLKNVKTMWVCQGSELPVGEVWDSCGINHNPGSEIVTVVTLSQMWGWLWSVLACGRRSQQSLSSSKKAASGKKSGLFSWYSWHIRFERQENGLEGSVSHWLSLFQTASKPELYWCDPPTRPAASFSKAELLFPEGLDGSREGHWVFGWQENMLLVFFRSYGSVAWCLAQ